MRSVRSLRRIKLPELPIAMPIDGPFAIDSAGRARPPTEESLAKARDAAIIDLIPMPKNTFWNLPVHDSLKFIAKNIPYHHLAEIIMEQSMFGLMGDMLLSHDAPLPHVIYTDLLQCKTFSSLQNPPDEHFILEPELLRSLLQMASFHLLHDVHYFATVEKLFRTMELQQPVGSELLSAWIQCCVFAGKTSLAIQTLERMERNGVPFDSDVFCSMMSPTSVGPKPNMKGDASVRLVHQRLFSNMSSVCSPSAVGLHAIFVANSLLMRHANKWESLRMALCYPSTSPKSSIEVSKRTLDLASEVLGLEKGKRCGPKTNEALAVAFVQRDGCRTEDLFKVLYHMRRVEELPQYSQEPPTVFSDESQKIISVAVRKYISEHPEKRLEATACLFLLKNGSDDFKKGIRIGGPLASALKSESDQFQFKELVSLVNKFEGSIPQPTAVAAGDSEVSEKVGHESTLVSISSSLSEEMTLQSDTVNENHNTSAPSTNKGVLPRLVIQENTARAKEAWAMARMRTAWINPSMVVSEAQQ